MQAKIQNFMKKIPCPSPKDSVPPAHLDLFKSLIKRPELFIFEPADTPQKRGWNKAFLFVFEHLYCQSKLELLLINEMSSNLDIHEYLEQGEQTPDSSLKSISNFWPQLDFLTNYLNNAQFKKEIKGILLFWAFFNFFITSTSEEKLMVHIERITQHNLTNPDRPKPKSPKGHPWHPGGIWNKEKITVDTNLTESSIAHPPSESEPITDEGYLEESPESKKKEEEAVIDSYAEKILSNLTAKKKAPAQPKPKPVEEVEKPTSAFTEPVSVKMNGLPEDYKNSVQDFVEEVVAQSTSNLSYVQGIEYNDDGSIVAECILGSLLPLTSEKTNGIIQEVKAITGQLSKLKSIDLIGNKITLLPIN